MALIKKISLFVLIIGYALAGINHFVHPAFYQEIIPSYIPLPKLMNILAGVSEILFAAAMLMPNCRMLAAWGIILMLAFFMPVHIQMLADAPVRVGNLHVSAFGAWLRILFQPVLMLWTWWHRR